MTLDVTVLRRAARWSLRPGRSTRRASRRPPGERMLEVVVEVDGRPLSRWGCDGVVCATPTGSTAYTFCAGGPVVWPEVEALLLVPISAHALFARPLVVSPTSVLAVELLAGTEGAGVLWCDGRRTFDLPPGARVEVRRGAHARPAGPAARGAVHRPAGRQVRACRSRAGAARPSAAAGRRRRTPMLEEIRIRSLGVIDEAVLELGPGFTAVTGETGAGKTMVVTALGLLLGGRADSGAVRTGASRPGSRASSASTASPASPRASRRPAASSRTTARPGPQVVRRGPLPGVAGGAAVPAAVLAEPRPRAGRRARPVRPAPAAPAGASARRSTGSPATGAGDAAGALRRRLRDRLRATEPSWPRSSRSARERAREADLLRFGLDEIEAVDPQPGEDAELAAEEGRLGYAEHAAHRRRAAHARRSRPTTGRRRAGRGRAAARTAARRRARARPAARPGSPTGSPSSATCSSDLAADLAAYAAGVEADPVRLAAVHERRAALTALTRKYGADRRRRARLGRGAAPRLLELEDADERIARADARGATSSRAELAATGAALTRGRAATAADALRPRVTAELAALAMPHARLPSRSTQHDDAAGPRWSAAGCGRLDGVDEVEILLAANPGADPGRCAKGASGGELSRVMLALEVVLAGTDPVPTFVFDEVDAGVGGGPRSRSARRLARLARTSQVARRHPPAAGRGVRRPRTSWCTSPATARSPAAASRPRRRRPGAASCPGCSPGWRTPSRRGPRRGAAGLAARTAPR